MATNKLTDTKCRSFDPGKKFDGGGLYLEITKDGRKYWRQKYRYAGKEKRLSHGVYPEVSLSEARDRRDAARKLLRDGIDPAQIKRQQKLQHYKDAVNTFEAIARRWHKNKIESWDTEYGNTVMKRMEADVFPAIGFIPIKDLTPPIILGMLKEIESRGAYEITRRAKQYCGQVLRYAISSGLAQYDITSNLSDSLREKKPTKHYASIAPEDLPVFLQAFNRNDVRMYPQTRMATELMLLTFLRTNELLKTQWHEINWEKCELIIPGERMKGRKITEKPDHTVPLSKQAISILRKLKKVNGHRDWVFASYQKPQTHMSNNTILSVIDRMGYKGTMTGHGFRSLAMTTLMEELNYPFDVVDAQLGHGKRGPLGGAYDRTKYIKQRTKMMQHWADYLESISNKSPNIIFGDFDRQVA